MLILPQYVKPFVKPARMTKSTQEAIAEAAMRPTMRTVPVRPAEQQAKATLLTVHELLVKQRTQLINVMRGLAAEFGIIAAKGVCRVGELLHRIDSDPGMPTQAREAITLLHTAYVGLEERITAIDRKLLVLHKENALSQLLAAIPGVGKLRRHITLHLL